MLFGIASCLPEWGEFLSSAGIERNCRRVKMWDLPDKVEAILRSTFFKKDIGVFSTRKATTASRRKGQERDPAFILHF